MNSGAAPIHGSIRRIGARQLRLIDSCQEVDGHWLFVGARVFTQAIRQAIDADGFVSWSAPSSLSPGDQVLLYEMGKPDQLGDPLGRKQAGWLLRARTGARPHGRWKNVADYDAVPLRNPLPLSDIRRALNQWRRGFLRQTRHRRLSPNDWKALLDSIAALNPAAVAELEQHPDRFFSTPPEGVGYDDLEFPDDGESLWRTELLLQAAVSELIEAEGWASRIDLGARVVRHRSDRGYHIPEINRYVDDVLLLRPEHLLIVEYELQADGDPRHGVAQAAGYRRELKQIRRFRRLRIDALVIATDFFPFELELSRAEGIECMQASQNSRQELVLSDVGTPGPASRLRAKREEQRLRAARIRLAERARRRRKDSIAA